VVKPISLVDAEALVLIASDALAAASNTLAPRLAPGAMTNP
jgi:hypothetical protein